MEMPNYSELLLGTLSFEKVLETVWAVLDETLQPKAGLIMIFDPDLETFDDRKYFGPAGKHLSKLGEAYGKELEADLNLQAPACGQLRNENYDNCLLPEDLGDSYYLHIKDERTLSACIILAGMSDVTAGQITERLAVYPLLSALQNGWEIRELKRENERLRSRYDDLEERNSILEEQTRKLIQDLKFKDGLRYRNMEQEKLLYQISNAMRSSLEIKDVLENAVNNVGEKCLLGRCIILRPSAATGKLYVYEYHNSSNEPCQELFFSEPGQDFVKVAMTKKAPYSLTAADSDSAQDFNSSFLQSLGPVSTLFIPLVMREHTVGCILVQDCNVSRSWSIEDLTFFGAIADQLSVAVENADLHEEKKLQAVTDSLTGLANRRKFNDVFYKEFERARRYGETLSLVLFDLDYLKNINDKFGHAVGDNAIKTIGHILSSSSRSIDLAARYGGEEFCLLLPNTLLEESEVIAERIRKLISDTIITGAGNISASVGIANFPMHANEPEELFEHADEALYAAKQSGRNRVCVFDNPKEKSNAADKV